MATSLLVLLDDIASILDDVSLLTKVVAKKSAGVLGDDLALNAQQVAGVKANRELPVVWAVAKGSFRNKAILVPAALLISAVAPWLITPLLMFGGAFLCYEGAEKLAHKFLHDAKTEHANTIKNLSEDPKELLAKEKHKIKGAVRTDLILSAEIIAITLGTVADAGFFQQVIVLSGIAFIMAAGVYGLVAGIVKLDDAGLALTQSMNRAAQKFGAGILWFAPWFMRTLSVVGTAAMLMVGGGILTHSVGVMQHWIENNAELAAELPYVGTVLGGLLPTLLNAFIGVAVGAVIVAAISMTSRLRNR